MAADYGFLDIKHVEDQRLVEIAGQGEQWWSTLDEDAKIRMSLGLAWEEWYLPKLPDVVHQPGEQQLEGIYMTPDGHSISAVYRQRKWKYTLAVHEVKVTTKSITTVGDLNFFNAKNWLWLTQVACNCESMQSNLGFLHVLYLYGDYKKPYTPKLHVWRLEFEDGETNTIWRRVVNYRDEKAAAGALR